MAWLWHQRLIRATVLLAAGSNPLFQALFLVVIVLAKSHGATASVIGLMLGGFGLGGVLGSLAGPGIQRRLPPRVVVIGAVWVWAALVPLIAVLASPYALGAVFAAMAFVGAAWNVVLNTFFYNLVPDALIGRVAGVGSLLSFGTLPLGSLAAGLLLQTAGPVTSTLVLAGLMLMVALAATLSPSVRHAPGLEPRTYPPGSST
jgi:predicted MFS family arabinose efflux permease